MSPVYVKSGTLFVRKRNTLQTSLFKSSKKAFNIYPLLLYPASGYTQMSCKLICGVT